MLMLHTTTALLLTVLCHLPSEDIAQDEVDLIEINHFYDEQGKLVFDQIIFYDWSADEGRYQVRAWRLLKRPSQVPQKSWPEGTYEAVWHDGDVTRRVRAKSLRESWTQYDPEMVERQYLPKHLRRELHRPVIASHSSQ